LKLSLLTAALLLTGSLYASNAHKISATQEGLVAVQLLDVALKDKLTEKVQETKMQENAQGMSTMDICITAANGIMKKMNSELPAYVKMSISTLDGGDVTNKTDLEVMNKYAKDIKEKTAGAMLMSSAKVGNTTRVYKPVVIDSEWLNCHDDKSEVKLGDFKGVLISEISAQH